VRAPGPRRALTRRSALRQALESARAAVAAAQRSSAALQAKKAELKQALAAAEAEAAACRAGGRGGDEAAGGSGDAAQLVAHGRKRVAMPQAEALQEDAPAPQHGGEHRTPDAHAASIDPEAAARDQAAANGGS
jgi:hypothetical protein